MSWLFLLLLFASAPGHAQSSARYRIDHWTTDDGLPSHTVHDLVQTPDGYLWLATTGGLVRFDGMRFDIVPTGPDGFPSKRVTGLSVGRGDTLWIVTEEGHLVRRNDGRFTILAGPGEQVNDVAQDRDGTVWVSRSSGLWRYKDGSLVQANDVDTFFMTRDYTHVTPQFWLSGTGDFWVRDDAADQMAVLRGDRLIPGPASPLGVIVTHPSKGLILFVRPRGDLYEVYDEADNVHAIFRPATDAMPRLIDRTGNLWVTSELGIEVFEPRNPEPIARLELPAGAGVGALVEDREGNIWAATGVHGLFRIQAFPFRVYGTADGFLENQVLRLNRGRDGSVLAIDRRWNLYRISDHGVELLFKATSVDGNDDQVQGAYEDRHGTLWLGRARGFPLQHFIEGRRAGAASVIIEKPGDTGSHQFLEDPTDDGVLWFHDRRSVLRARTNDTTPAITDVFLNATPPNLRHIYRSRDGVMWAGSTDGLVRIEHGKVTVFTTEHGLPINAVRAIHEDAEGVLWLGTYGGGIVRFRDGRFGTIRAANGLAEDVVSTILADDAGNFWMSGNQGVHRVARAELTAFLDGQAGRVHGVSYGRAAGIPNPEASGWEAYRSEDGRLWFPTFEGVAVVDPAFALSLERDPPLVHVEAVRAGDQLMERADGVRLAADQRRFEITYTGINLRAPQAVRFQYRLDGFDPHWNDAGTERRATYTNVPPGQYTFRVRAMNAGGIWSQVEATLPLSIRPYFIETIWFYLFAAGAVLLLGYGIYRNRVRRLREREARLVLLVRERTEQLVEEKGRAERALAIVATQAEQLRSVDEAKSRFFANVSHEFRTPLTLILGPLDDLEEGRAGALPSPARDLVGTARRNGQRLTRLVDQLLDVVRLEAGKLRLRLEEGDVVEFLRDVARSFAPLAERRGVEFVVELPPLPLTACFDPSQLDKVLANLLGNAFKFTEAGGQITLRARRDGESEPGELLIEVADTGPGIAPAHLTHVFERFYQADDSPRRTHGGIGVGLSLASELVELHGGRISATSVEGRGSTFRVWLPLVVAEASDGAQDSALSTPIRHDFLENGTAYGDTPPAPARPGDVDIPTIVLVEDNAEVRAYVRTHLSGSYRVIEAADGPTGLTLARDIVPDLVISDVMMPGMDGEALCRAIKDDPELDFVPVVLLTARASPESRVAGLEGGADDYLTKPFDMRELLARVRNIIGSRRRLRERLGQEAKRVLAPSIPAEVDDAATRALLVHVYQILADNIADEEFGVDQLARGLAMSRATLYRQLHGVIEESPMELIWRYRLEQAALWLSDTDSNVSEVAYAVGFKSVPHFCSRFRDRFGASPSSFRNARQTA